MIYRNDYYLPSQNQMKLLVDMSMNGRKITFYDQKIYTRKSSFRHAIIELISAKAIEVSKDYKYPFRKIYILTENGESFVKMGLKK